MKRFRSLVSMAQEACKPIFNLTPAERAIGSHLAAVQNAFNDLKDLTVKILEQIEIQQES